MDQQIDARLTSLEIKVDILYQQITAHEAALKKVGEFVRKVEEAAIDVNDTKND
jgi:hypothetical protein